MLLAVDPDLLKISYALINYGKIDTALKLLDKFLLKLSIVEVLERIVKL